MLHAISEFMAGEMNLAAAACGCPCIRRALWFSRRLFMDSEPWLFQGWYFSFSVWTVFYSSPTLTWTTLLLSGRNGKGWMCTQGEKASGCAICAKYSYSHYLPDTLFQQQLLFQKKLSLMMTLHVGYPWKGEKKKNLGEFGGRDSVLCLCGRSYSMTKRVVCSLQNALGRIAGTYLVFLDHRCISPIVCY